MKKVVFLSLFLFDFIFASNNFGMLFYGNCTVCHEIKVPKTAPSIVEIKARYKRAFPAKQDFVKYMSQWVYAPNAKTSIMQHSITKYGLMPHLGYDIESLKQITSYIYETEFIPN